MVHSPSEASLDSPDLSGVLRAGDTVIWGQAHAEPQTLIRALVAQHDRIGPLRIFLGIGHFKFEGFQSGTLDFVSYCGSGTNRSLVERGLLKILPIHYSRLPGLLEGPLRPDVLMLKVPPPDPAGRYSLGLAREYLVSALKVARVVLAEVDPHSPWTFGGPYLDEKDFNLLIPTVNAKPVPPTAEPTLVEQRIGRHVASLIDDGMTLQTGIGGVPDSVLRYLRDRRNLGIHSGSIGPGVVDLVEAGAVTNALKPIDRGITIGGVLMGGDRVRSWAHNNPALELRDTRYTHSAQVLSALSRLVAINSAIEVDLTGQINTEVAAGRYLGAVGGILDFLRGAQNSSGGLPIVALPSTAGPRSRIVATLSSPVSVPRSEDCVIVTEHGIADLRGLSLRERRSRLIAIADPAHRECLERETFSLSP